ncbi:Tannase/feruloyl esterase [Aspergillus undulatus]|uniref:Tannase/feruloyl esterase n=1 Tax=Aspergillus undulatus TaxID=1810928 RepID=UPI003CCDAFBE
MDSFLRCSGLLIPQPDLPGASINLLYANVVSNASAYVPESAYTNHGPVNVTDVSFCVVSIAYTHTSQSDVVNTQVWLPLNDTWNGRMMGIGGGGFYCGLYPANFMAMLAAVGEGYAAVSTDCGHTVLQTLEDWLLESPGHVNEHLLEDFASVALNDAAILGKSVTESFYGQAPEHSYFSGCSQGGRQGMILAQKYPDAYNGIAAASPAVNWANILVAGFYTQLVMNELDSHPQWCELDYLTNAAIRQCDELDGVHDGIVSDMDACEFDAFDLVGSAVPCGEQTVPLSESAAVVATAAWQGPSTGKPGVSLWEGVDVVANLTDGFASQCSPDGRCTGLPVVYSSDWIRLAVRKDPSFDLNSITQREYTRIFYDSVKEYQSVIGSNDPDLSEFRQRGGKILTFHGLMVPSRGTRRYYESTARRDPFVRNYYRLFEAPGLGHCWSPTGLYPSTIFDDLVAWVEEGRTPHSLPVSFIDEDNVRHERILCPYPERAVYDGRGDPTARSSYYCSADGIDLESNVYTKPTET